MPVFCVLLSLFLVFVYDSFDSASESKSCVVIGAFISLWQFLSNIAWKCPHVTSIQKLCCFTRKLGREAQERRCRRKKKKKLSIWKSRSLQRLSHAWDTSRWAAVSASSIDFLESQAFWLIQDPGSSRCPTQDTRTHSNLGRVSSYRMSTFPLSQNPVNWKLRKCFPCS